ncbi:T9SS-dependent M36 family metallopeptidase [Flavobacterium sp.]|uniref:T9SS-dependent M36 family metallopeptidase n=1 Tax=Flavobacterium sp. TaxID=239 RepID=UPI002637B49B|nr:T9SS-dependent M36 family metallopeptidase [Flavobacterium sp.]MDG2431434.1 T9SS-dependent M36 family metallopeptidase [Flavobacterium sp.]
MRKITLIAFLLISVLTFSQSNKDVIQNYLNSNTSKFGLSKNDVQDWFIQSEATSSSTNINSNYVIQRYNGIEIFRAVTNFAIKDKKVVDTDKKFIANVSGKINGVTPKLSAVAALSKAYSILGITEVNTSAAVEKVSQNKFKINDKVTNHEPIEVNLVYHQAADGKLMLAWDLTIETPKHDHLWSVRIDALNGALLEKNDLVISCQFDTAGALNQTSETASSSLLNFDNSYKQLFSPAATAVVGGGSYRVIPFNYESPNHSSRQLVTDPANSKASPFGWHDVNGVAGAEYTITRGNNVWAKDDFFGTSRDEGSSPDGGSGLLFDFPYGGTSVAASSYINAATTNLFYMSNVMHDVWYQYGFNEASGNFQQNNYGLGGAAEDYIDAEAQDGSLADPISLNNANFSTPRDGSRGRMQMFLWNRAAQIKPIIVNSPSSIAGSYVATQNSFNPGLVALPVTPQFIQSDLVLYLDSTGGTSQACVLPSNAEAMNGKIVVVRRGTCPFVDKVKAAQNAGAIAVIVVNTEQTNITMSGGDAAIVIPAISVTNSIGEALINQMKSGLVNVKLQVESDPFINSDGDFDNGIIAHEYGHGISTRLAGGRLNSSCLNNTDQMGEGWSDWFALMMQLKPGDVGTAKRGIGTFVSGQTTDGLGIRSYVYSTDRSLNPMTYAFTNNFQFLDEDDVEQTSVHGVGSVWATMLWDLTWAYINKYGYNDNKYTGNGGNNKIMQLVIDGLKMMPCSPTFVTARNALIAADQATTGGKDFCMIWEVFAARGLGVNASAGDGNIGNDQVEDFTRPVAGANCTTLGITDFDNEDVMKVYPNPSNGIVNIQINKYFGTVDVQLIDITGKQIYSAKNVDFNGQKSIDLSAITSGIYLLKVTGESLNFVEKIILN